MTFVINGTTGATQSASFDSASTFGFKNRIINGAMVIDQRNAGASVTPNNTYTLDRWAAINTQTGKFTVQQSSTAPAGFTKSLLVTSSSAYSVLTGDTLGIKTTIEGFNIADFGWGAAGAATVTLSFWVRSSLTGTFGGALENGAANRTYPFSYTISAANTWEQKTITIAGDITGTWATDNTLGLDVRFGLGSGATFSGTSGAWASGNIVQPTSTVSVVGTNGATFYITGVQLEKSSTATSFDYRPYGTELALCQRYYQKSYSAATAVASTTFVGMEWMSLGASGRIANTAHLIQSMRDAPAITPYDQAGTANRVRTSAGNGQTGYNIQTISTEKFVMDYNASITELLYHWTASAEL